MRHLKDATASVAQWMGTTTMVPMPADLGLGAPTAAPQEQSASEEWDEMTSLTMQQRLYGFGMCLLMGVVFTAIAISFVPVIAVFPKKFAFFYSCGSLFCVGCTSFLVGPARQVQLMFEAHRAHAAAAYVASLLLTLVAAVKWNSAVLSFGFAACQIAAVLWYALSFVPFARYVVGTALSYAMVVARPVAGMCVSACGGCARWMCSAGKS